METRKESVKQYWDAIPCGTGGIKQPVGTFEYYEAINDRRNRLDPLIAHYAKFEKWSGREVLEIGCGVGSDLVRFAKAGALVKGIDLSPKSVGIAKARLSLYKCGGEAYVADAENLPFKDDEFTLVYSWGVLHHTPDIDKAISEIHRVLKPKGEVCVMLYHKPSLVSLQMYLLFGLFALKPFRSVDDILAQHHESYGTKAYTVGEARRMFAPYFSQLRIETIVTLYDIRYKRDGYMPRWVGGIVPKCLGWDMIIQGIKV